MDLLRADAFAFCEARDAQRLTLFRRMLQLTVRHVSPLVRDLMNRPALERALHQLRPQPEWPDRFSELDCMTIPLGLHRRLYSSASASDRSRDRRFQAQLARMGAVVRLPSHPAGGLGIVVRGSHLGVCLAAGGATFWSCGGRLWLTVPAEIPETVRCGAVGRPIGDLVGHPALTGRHYPLSRLRTASGMLTAEAHTGYRPFAMPWPHLRKWP